MGASFIAAAALPLFAITPLAQADAGHGGPAAANQAQTYRLCTKKASAVI